MSDQKVTPKDSKEPRPLGKTFAAYLGALLCGLYLVGDLTTLAISALFFGCLSYFGIDLVPFRRKPKK